MFTLLICGIVPIGLIPIWTGTGTSGAAYKGQSATKSKNQEYVQLKSTGSTSGIVTTKSAGNVSKVIVVWDASTTDGRTLDIYGKNTAYSAASDLYNDSNTQGTKLGSIVKGTSTELAIEGDYAFIGLRSKSGAMYLTQIQIVSVKKVNTTSHCLNDI